MSLLVSHPLSLLTHPPTHRVQHLIRTASFSSSSSHPPIHPPHRILCDRIHSTASAEEIFRVSTRLSPTSSSQPPTHPKSSAPHSNRLVLTHPPTHLPQNPLRSNQLNRFCRRDVSCFYAFQPPLLPSAHSCCDCSIPSETHRAREGGGCELTGKKRRRGRRRRRR